MRNEPLSAHENLMHVRHGQQGDVELLAYHLGWNAFWDVQDQRWHIWDVHARPRPRWYVDSDSRGRIHSLASGLLLSAYKGCLRQLLESSSSLVEDHALLRAGMMRLQDPTYVKAIVEATRKRKAFYGCLSFEKKQRIDLVAGIMIAEFEKNKNDAKDHEIKEAEEPQLSASNSHQQQGPF